VNVAGKRSRVSSRVRLPAGESCERRLLGRLPGRALQRMNRDQKTESSRLCSIGQTRILAICHCCEERER
jgi:hypothetical protein